MNPRRPSPLFIILKNFDAIMLCVAGAVLAFFLLALLSGCTMPPLKGGRATTAHGMELAQGENPAATSAQNIEEERIYTLPAGSIIRSGDASNRSEVVLSLPMPIVEKRKARSELGAAQKDTAREIAAKLGSLKGVVWAGVVMFFFGVASLFWPPLRAIIGSVTTSAAISAGGLALIILPSVIVGHEAMILGFVAGAVGLWWIAHRHGGASAIVKRLSK